MRKSIIFLAGLLIGTMAYAQKIEELKKKSEDHSKSSGNNSGRMNNGSNRGSGKGYSDGSSSEFDPSCMLDGCSLLFDILSAMDWSKNRAFEFPAPQPEKESNHGDIAPDSLYNFRPPASKPNSENPSLNKEEKGYPVEEKVDNTAEDRMIVPFEKISLSVRGNFYPSNFHIWIPEVTLSSGHYSFSARLLTIAERRLYNVDHYSTFDVQPIQINFVNKHDFLFKIGVGFMAETFSENIYIELTANSKWRIGNKIDMGVEGRMANDDGIVRQEASVYLNYALWQKNNKQLLLGLNGMISEYYQAVDFNTLGASVGFRF